MQRQVEHDINNVFINRWSPRSFDESFSVDDELIKTLVEAARWSPSSFNDQPWRFHIAKREGLVFDTFVELLTDQNQIWARDASALGFIVAKKISDKTGDENPLREFDSGAAWMALTMQARDMGLYTHGMAGIHKEKVYEKLNISTEDFDVICAFALGKKAPVEHLPKELQPLETMSSRKNLNDILFNY